MRNGESLTPVTASCLGIDELLPLSVADYDFHPFAPSFVVRLRTDKAGMCVTTS